MLAKAYQLSLFSDLHSMDEIVDKFKYLVNQFVSRGKKNLFAVVEHLRRYSAKTRGVSFCKVSTMAKILEISERTVQRIINRLVELGLVARKEARDEKTGAQLPNYYQLQSRIDWQHVVDCLAPVIMVEDDTPNVTQDDTPNVTPSNEDKPMVHKESSSYSVWGSTSKAFKSIKNIYESKKEYTPFPFYNWLEPDKN